MIAPLPPCFIRGMQASVHSIVEVRFVSSTLFQPSRPPSPACWAPADPDIVVQDVEAAVRLP